MEVKKLWKDSKSAYQESLIYLKGRQSGEIKSFLTPWPKFNDATTNGIELNSLIVIAGRPGAGKTLVKDQIVRSLKSLNPEQDFRVLEFQLEMLARTSKIREYSSVIGKSYKYLCSADVSIGSLSIDDLNRCYEYAKTRVNDEIDIIEEPLTVSEFKEQIITYMNYHAKEVEGVKEYIKTIITLDHSLLLKKSSYEKDKYEMLYNLGEVLTELKRKFPISFIILSQLNRNIDNPERNENGKYGNYILESDVFGADALLQHADTLIGLNRPGKQKIRFYGPDRYIIEDDKVLVMHFLKCRNGDVRMSFFKSQFEKMQIIEMENPPTQQGLGSF